MPQNTTNEPGDTLEDNVRYLLDQCPHTVRDMSGERTGSRGVEDLAGSLAITFLKLQGMAAPARKPTAVAGAAVLVPPLTESQRADLLRVARYLAANNDQDASIPGAEAERIATVLRNIVRAQPASAILPRETSRA